MLSFLLLLCYNGQAGSTKYYKEAKNNKIKGIKMKTYGNLNMSKIKTIIFDFDETMYYSSTIRERYVEYIKKTVMTLSDHNEKETMELMDKYGFTSNGETRVSFGKNCDKFGVTKQQWDDYRIKNFFQIDYDTAKTVPNYIYDKLSKKYNLYIVSNEVFENVNYKAKMMHIDLQRFKKVYAPTAEILKNYLTKSEVYKIIRESENCKFQEMMVVGDRYSVDIQPLEELGGNGLLINHVDEITNFFNKVTNEQPTYKKPILKKALANA